jgi:hypothetical protein
MENPVYEKLKGFEESELVWSAALIPRFYQHEEERLIQAISVDEPDTIPANEFCTKFGSNLEARVIEEAGSPIRFDFHIPKELVHLTEMRHQALCKWSLDRFTEAYNDPPKDVIPFVLSGIYAGLSAALHTILSGFHDRPIVVVDTEGYRARLTANYQRVRGRLERNRWKVSDIMLKNYFDFVDEHMPGLMA